MELLLGCYRNAIDWLVSGCIRLQLDWYWIAGGMLWKRIRLS